MRRPENDVVFHVRHVNGQQRPIHLIVRFRRKQILAKKTDSRPNGASCPFSLRSLNRSTTRSPMKPLSKTGMKLTDHMGLIAIGLAVVYWSIESFMAFVTKGSLPLSELLWGTDAVETQTRVIVLCILAIFGSHAQYTINTRKQAEDALRKSEERYRTLIQNLPIGVVRTAPDVDGLFLMTNPAFLEMVGAEREADVLRMCLADIFMDEDSARSIVDTLLSESGISWIEIPLKRLDGSEFWGLLSARLAHAGSQTNMTFFDCTIKDVTAQKEAARRIREEEETRRRFQRLLSPDLAEMVATGKLDVEKGGSSRIATVMFVDIRNFTAMSEFMDASDVLRMLNEYFEEVVEIVFLHEGTVDKFIGDEIMVLWGAPIVHEDGAARAVRAAIDIQATLIELNNLRPPEDRIQVGIGINTGPLVAGYIGSTRTMSYSVIGDTVNTAARICSAARPGQILISENTFIQVAGSFEINALDSIIAKGKREPVSVYEVVEDKQYATVHLYIN